MKTINIAKDFSKYPGGRFIKDGPHSGEEFRDKMLYPVFQEGGVIIELDGTLGYGSSFLEEAFGGLVRKHNVSASDFDNKVKLVTKYASLIAEINEYINRKSSKK